MRFGFWATTMLLLAACSNEGGGTPSAMTDDDGGDVTIPSGEAVDGTPDATGDEGSSPDEAGGAGSGALDPAAGEQGADDPADPAVDGPAAGDEPAAGDGPVAGDGASGDGSLTECEMQASRSTPCHDDPDPCGIDTDFAGDEYCLLPPEEGEGVQIHFGPDDYSDPAQIDEYVLEPGEEFNAYGIADIPTTEDHWYDYVRIQMRPGSHHVINRVIEGKAPEGFSGAGADCAGSSLGGFPGTQNLIKESPPRGIPAPENEGLGSRLRGGNSLCVNHHGYNFGDERLLREVWINVRFVDEADVTQRTNSITVFAPIGQIAPGEQYTAERTTTIQGTGRIIRMFGHRHAWTERFAVWLNEDLVYDSWDWQESVVFDYNSITENPPPEPEAKLDGAVSGKLEVSPGDQLKIQCDINNQGDHTLTFRNALYEGEMCILFGRSVGVSIR